MVLYDVHSEYEVQRICAALSRAFNRPFEPHNGQRITMHPGIGFALTWEHATAENYKNWPIEICIRLNTACGAPLNQGTGSPFLTQR